MKTRRPETSGVSCLKCRHFVNDPQRIELSIPGLNTLSSAFGSVRGEAGLCARLDRFVAPWVECRAFEKAGN
ncbi:MAG: hypothetical protein M0018_11670 [Nitrospiraceae bacterium]|nr:hypothetical protein [Nitrospiraceae bacterium]